MMKDRYAEQQKQHHEDKGKPEYTESKADSVHLYRYSLIYSITPLSAYDSLTC